MVHVKKEEFGEQVGSTTTEIPGTRSRSLKKRLKDVESRNITYIDSDFPVFWKRAFGSNVEDVDGNIYVDFTSAFGVANLGHGNRRIATAIAEQLTKLTHGMGDVHPPEIKVELLERLTSLFPGNSAQAILCSGGSEAVEAALKTAFLATGKPGVIAFDGAYHGLSYGTLSLNGHLKFREPFHGQLAPITFRARFPKDCGDKNRELIDRSLTEIEFLLTEAENKLQPIGAILLEPIQGRAGVIVPPSGWLTAVRELATRKGLVLIADEIFTGFGRTGERFAVNHESVVPDILCLGKALTGMLPFSACVGRYEVMEAWPESSGEALHTSTFLGNPLGCAAAIASINELERKKLSARSLKLGNEIKSEIRSWRKKLEVVEEVRGRGFMIGVSLQDSTPGEPKTGLAFDVAKDLLKEGLIVLPSGQTGNVLSITPPLTISGRQLEWGLEKIQAVLKTRFQSKQKTKRSSLYPSDHRPLHVSV